MDAHKKELLSAYKQRPLTGGVFVIRNTENGRYWLDAQTNIEGSHSRFVFAQMTDDAPAPAMREDWKKYGKNAFTFEILEELIQKETQTPAEFSEDVRALGELWAEKFDASLSYR